jgi:hypothetical protein
MRGRGLCGLAALAVVMVAAPCSAAGPEPTTGTSDAVQALAFDFAGHPDAEAVDLYKFVHEAMFGPGHAISDPAQAADALKAELATLGPPTTGESWCDTLGGDPFLVRVNLRPFVANGFDSQALLDSFVATAGAVRPDPQQMGVALELVVRWLESVKREDLARELERLAREMEKQGYPAAHHSAAYQQAYRPAYRVIEASIAGNFGWCGSSS